MTVRAFVSAGVGIDIGIASGFVKGGVEGIVGLDMIDVGERAGISDGKVRGSDIIEKLSTKPSDLFDLTGTVNAFLAAEVKVNLLFFKKTVYNNRLATFELARFKIGDSGGRTSLGGRVQTGPIVGGIVWFDANNNYVRDEYEPFTETDEEGNYTLDVPDDADLETGTVRVEGGRDASTGVTNHTDVSIPHGGHGNATGWTALEEALVTDGGMTTAQSQTAIETAFGIDPSIDLSSFAHLDEALAGNAKAGPVLLGENQVNTAASQLIATLEGAMGTSLDDKRYAGLLSEAVFIAMARQLKTGTLDLTNRSQIEQILLSSVEVANQLLTQSGASIQVNQTLINKFQNEIVSVVQATMQNQRALSLRATDVIDLARRITQDKVLANGKVTEDLYLMLRSLKSPSDVLHDDARTDNAYLQSIEQVALPPLVSAIHDVSVVEDQAIPVISLTVRRQSSGSGEARITVSSDNPRLLPASAVIVTPTSNNSLTTKFDIQLNPVAYQFGKANITLHVVDSAGGSTEETFAVTVGWADHAPEAKNDSFQGFLGKTTTMAPLANDIDRDGDELHVTLLSIPSDGQTVLNKDGTFTYTASSNVGRRTFKYQIDDGNGSFSVATVTLDLSLPTANLAVFQSATPVITSGHEIAYSITVRNNGPQISENVVVFDALPPGTVFASVRTPTGFTAVTPAGNASGNVVFSGGNLSVGQSVTFYVFATVLESLTTTTTISNTVIAQAVNAADNSVTSKSAVNSIGAALTSRGIGDVNDLAVSGSTGSDFVFIRQDSKGTVVVEVNGKKIGTYQPTGRIVVYAGTGNDTVLIDPSVTREVILFGDAGHDVLHGSKGGSVMVGGAGNDTLIAKASRNVLIGGIGTDTIDGSIGENLEIAGSTLYDAQERALIAILNEWASNRTYDQRIASIEQGSGGLNEAYTLNSSSVFNDDAVDVLLGGSRLNWYFSHETGNRKDSVVRRRANEKTSRI